jgi:hypothetical protein
LQLFVASNDRKAFCLFRVFLHKKKTWFASVALNRITRIEQNRTQKVWKGLGQDKTGTCHLAIIYFAFSGAKINFGSLGSSFTFSKKVGLKTF